MYLSIKHFRRFLEGRPFHILTDHKPLTFALNTRADSPHQACHLDYIEQFTSDVRHVKGTTNAPADALSRIELNALIDGSPPVVNFKAMAGAQGTDQDILFLQSSSSFSSLKLESVPLSTSDTAILCDTSTGIARPLVPKDYRRIVFESLHNLSHPSIRATQQLLTDRYVWPGIKADSPQKLSPWSISQLRQLPAPLCQDGFGVPSIITTDCGRHFESALWEQMTCLLGIQRIHTTSCHPIANGMVECFHRQLKATLKTYPTPERHFPWFYYNIMARPSASLENLLPHRENLSTLKTSM